MYAQIYIINLMAFVFGPFLPVMFVYALLGMLVLEVTNRLRIAYSVKRFPKYDEKVNLWMMTNLKIMPFAYSLMAINTYSN